MASTWIWSADGHLVNLDQCSQVHLERDHTEGGVEVVAFAASGGTSRNYVLAHFPGIEEATAALQSLARTLGAAGPLQLPAERPSASGGG